MPLLEEIERRLAEDQDFSEIEDLIESSDADDDLKAALWLYAYIELDPARRRHDTREMVRLFSRDQATAV